MISERERRILARIEHQLVESDPDLVRLFAGEWRPRRQGSIMPTVLLVTGLAMLVLGSLLAVVTVALTGMALSVFALFVAHTRPSAPGRPRLA